MTAALALFQARAVLRGRWSIVGVVAFGLAAGMVAFLGLGSFRQLGLGAVGPAAISLVNLALLLPTAQALLLGALALSGERESGFLAALRARGHGTLSVIVTTWLAVTLSAWLSLVAGFAVVALVVAGNVPMGDLPVFLVLLGLCGTCATVAAAVGVLVGAAVASRLQAALVAVAAWFLLAVGLDLIVVGLGVFLRFGEPAILVAILANPIEAARVGALLLLDATGSALGPLGLYLLDRLGREGAVAGLWAALALWGVGALALARFALGRRDLAS
jgi:ABC-type transport system involved in multi-copper enzyme maturation permease subunit